ncbi:hypothetical protein Scep_014976 [Stephania cephalantha]|uniref:Yippee domain-containing protein n=1 Tax=Stephania cephalantha TaxID=152367 RepID=A0AAP0P2B7_9MAGN
MEARLDRMEARLDQIKEEAKRISAIEVSIGELRSEVKWALKCLAQRFDEQLHHYLGLRAPDPPDLEVSKLLPITGDLDPLTIKGVPTVGDTNLVASKVTRFVGDTDLVTKQSLGRISEVKSKKGGLVLLIDEPLHQPRARSSRISHVQQVGESYGPKVPDPGLSVGLPTVDELEPPDSTYLVASKMLVFIDRNDFVEFTISPLCTHGSWGSTASTKEFSRISNRSIAVSPPPWPPPSSTPTSFDVPLLVFFTDFYSIGDAYLGKMMVYCQLRDRGYAVNGGSSSVNITVGEKEDRMMITGKHTVADIFCVGCGLILGWKYEAAYERLQKYKEGKFILEKWVI